VGSRKQNPESKKLYNRKYRAAILARDPECIRRRSLKDRYGLTLEAWKEMYAAQGGRCAICKRQNKKGVLVVDHCHATKKVRGLLCLNCNLILGRLEDSPGWFVSASLYLGGTRATEAEWV
jgi:recombination endonuclease VII